jgi:hypothetical protein
MSVKTMRCKGIRGLVVGLAILTLTLAVSAAGVAAAPASAGPVPPVRTPGLGEVFNGYAVGSMTGGHFGSPGEIFNALAPNDPFYREPRLTGTEKPGTLLKSKKVDVMFTGLKPANLDAYKIMYVTTGLDAKTPEISTGIIMVPRGKPTASHKVISYQEANDSVGGYCHPSSQWTGGDPLDGSSWSALGPLALMFDKGYSVVISDVGNNGDLSPHGVFAGKYAAHTQLDAVRAATQAPAGIVHKPKVVLFGIAGGGVGAAHAAELQGSYAPELDVRGTVLEGMVVNQRNFLRVTSGSVGSGFGFATLLGLEPKYPEMKLDEKLTPIGKQIADYYRTQCQTPAYFMMPFIPLSALFVGNRNPADIKEFQHVYDDNLLGTRAPKAPVLITSCRADDSPMSLVPAQDARNLAATYRRGGTNVTYAGSDCSMVKAITDIYGWGTDLFGMQTLPWIDSRLR